MNKVYKAEVGKWAWFWVQPYQECLSFRGMQTQQGELLNGLECSWGWKGSLCLDYPSINLRRGWDYRAVSWEQKSRGGRGRGGRWTRAWTVKDVLGAGSVNNNIFISHSYGPCRLLPQLDWAHLLPLFSDYWASWGFCLFFQPGWTPPSVGTTLTL